MIKGKLVFAFSVLLAMGFSFDGYAQSEAAQFAEETTQILSEMEEASQVGDYARARALGTVYTQTAERAREYARELRGQGRQDEASQIASVLNEGAGRHQAALERVRTQVPEQGRQGIDRALEASRQGYDAPARAAREASRGVERRSRGLTAGLDAVSAAAEGRRQAGPGKAPAIPGRD